MFDSAALYRMMLDASSVKPTAPAYPMNGQATTIITNVLVIGQGP
jgi:hypothetical protein